MGKLFSPQDFEQHVAEDDELAECASLLPDASLPSTRYFGEAARALLRRYGHGLTDPLVLSLRRAHPNRAAEIDEFERALRAELEPEEAGVEVQDDGRWIASDLLVMHYPFPDEEKWAEGALQEARRRGLRIELHDAGLRGGTARQVQQIHALACRSFAALFLASRHAVERLRADDAARALLSLLATRTGGLDVVTQPELVDDALWSGLGLRARPYDQIPAALVEVEARLFDHDRDGHRRILGIPVCVVAMTREEALHLEANLDLLRQKAGLDAAARFEVLLNDFSRRGRKLSDRYGTTREEWRPFGGPQNIGEVLGELVRRMGELCSPHLDSATLKVQWCSADELCRTPPAGSTKPCIGATLETYDVYKELASSACIVAVDEVSLFHPDLLRALVSSPLRANAERVSWVTISPLDPNEEEIYQHLGRELETQWHDAVREFRDNYNAHYELRVGEKPHFQRWLSRVLPAVAFPHRHVGPNDERLRAFASRLAPSRSSRPIGLNIHL